MDNVTNWIGWGSSLILVLTLSKQLLTQWKERSSEGVSRWLFWGQVSAQVGFATYSYLLKNMVFLFTNAVLVLVSITGLFITYKFKRQQAKQEK